MYRNVVQRMAVRALARATSSFITDLRDEVNRLESRSGVTLESNPLTSGLISDLRETLDRAESRVKSILDDTPPTMRNVRSIRPDIKQKL